MQAICPGVDRISTLPIVAHFRTATDHKVHQAVVMSDILTHVGVIIATVSAVCTFVVSFNFSLGIAAGIGIYVTGRYFASTPAIGKSLPKAKTPPLEKERPAYVKGQHPGLENASMNCWMNALLQFSFHVPPLRAHLQRTGSKVFRDAITAFDRSKNNKEVVATTIDSQKHREWLAARVPGISDSSGNQEDAQEGLLHLMQGYPPVRMKITRNNGRAQADELWNAMTVSLGGAGKRSFEEIIQRNFLSLNDGHGGGKKQFRDCPQHLFFHLSRFNYGLLGGDKITDRINMKAAFTIRDGWVTSGHGAKYHCQAFIEHIGDSLDGGHYVCYARYNGSWWCFDDETVTRVPTPEAERKIGDTYISYYSRD